MLRKMLEFFDDSSLKGKLYINYPMMQSYRHIIGQNDEGFKDRKVSVELGRGYKSLVDKEAWNTIKQINKLDRGLLRWIIELHLCKMNYLLNGVYEMPTYHQYKTMKGERILKYQLDSMASSGSVAVLNTSMFLIVDYHPSWFFNDVHPGE
ncbi:MAG: hypothetical protein J5673_01945 [Candidatus Methanomethylophilaceae archaeon]|nr:hypothetical protein [Candidatus Methanomethylophilaceae archaeon]